MKSLAFFSLFALMKHTTAKDSNTTCVCKPTQVSFEIDTSAGCTQSFNKGSQTGIIDSYCIIRGSKTQQNLVPVNITGIKIFELKGDLTTDRAPTEINATSDGSKLSDGSGFSYSFYPYTSANALSGGVQIMIRGVNSDGDNVTQDAILAYTNNCGSLVFEEGDQIGFLNIVS